MGRKLRSRCLKGTVCHLTSVHPADDVRITVKECTSLAEAGWKVHLVAPGNLPAGQKGVVHHRLPAISKSRLRRMVLQAWHTYRKASKISADIYHFHDPELIPAGFLLKIFGKKVFYDVHENVPLDVLSKNWIPFFLRPIVGIFIGMIERAGGFFFDGVLTATPSIARRFPAKKTVCLCNFPRLSEFPPSGSRARNLTARFVYIGLLNRDRGLMEMLRALKGVSHPAASLDLAGSLEGANRNSLLRDLGLPGKVSYHGRLSRKKVGKLLSTAAAGLAVFRPLPNHSEAQPNKMFEYMAAGLPVIASNFPLWAQIIGRAKCGLLVDPLDVSAIAKAMQWIADHPRQAFSMGRRGRIAVQKKFNWEQEAPKMLKFYERVAGASR